MIDLSAVVEYFSAVSVVGALVCLIILERRHAAIRLVKEIQIRHSSAVHEAGHAVAVVICGLNLRGVDITQVRKGNGQIQCGQCTYNGNRVLRRIVTAYAGPIAQAKAYPFLGRHGCEGDHSHAEEYLELYLAVRGPNGLTKNLLREWCKDEASKLVNEHWESIRKVAGELLAREAMTGEEVKALIVESVAKDKSQNVAPEPILPTGLQRIAPR